MVLTSRPPLSADSAFYLVLCVAAIGFAAHSPRYDRIGSVVASAMLLANWLICAATYAVYSPQSVARDIGIPMTGIDVWACADATLGGVVLTLSRARWWGWVLWAIAMAQLALHGFNMHMSDAVYLGALDKLLLAQVAIFIFLGSNGVVQRISGWRDRISRIRRLVRHAEARTKATP